MSALKIHYQFTSDFLRDKEKNDVLLQWQPVQGNYLVMGSPLSSQLLLYERGEQKIKEISLPAPCTHLTWNRHGQLLALVCPKSKAAHVYLWSPVNQRLINQELDTWDSGRVTWMAWSSTADVLSIAYSSGNVILLDKASDKRNVARGHHSGPVMDGAWSDDGILATCSMTRSSDGEKPTTSRFVFVTADSEVALAARECSYGKVTGIQFATSKFVQGGQRQQNTLSCIANEKTLVLFNLEDDNRSLQYSFKSEYGNIIQYSWFGDGYVLLSFQKGVLIWVSSHPDEQGKELQHLKIFNGPTIDMSATTDGLRFGICSENVMKVFQTDLAKMRQTEAVLPQGVALQKLAWTSDGALVAAVDGNGQGFIFLAKIPDIGCAWRDRVAFMVTLDTFHVAEIRNLTEEIGIISCQIEPTVVALGPTSFVAAVNNLAVYYMADDQAEDATYITLGRYEYLGIIRTISLTWQHVVIFLTDGRIITHGLPTDPETFIADVEKSISTISGLQDVTCVALAEKSLYFGTAAGTIGFLSLPEHRHELAVQHTTEIVSIFVKEQDALVAFIDAANEVFLYCLTGDVCLKIAGFTGKPLGVLFDWVDGPEQTGDYSSVFIVHGESAIQVNVFVQHSILGNILEKVEDTDARETVGRSNVLLGLSNGDVAELNNGILAPKRLKVFPQRQPGQTVVDVERLLKLHRYYEAAGLCRKENLSSHLNIIGQRCVQELDINLAISAYRECGCYDKVLLLERYQHIEHLPTLAGYMALIDEKPHLACEWFLRASDHSAALDTYTDLMEWEKAIALAETHAPEKISYARQQYAVQLELLGDHPSALQNYEKALSSLLIADSEFEKACKTGMAKISIRMGDIPKGLALCRELRDQILNEECAGLLEDGRHFKDAGRMYRESGNMQKAAAMFLRAKEWKQAEEIIEKTDSAPLRIQLAKAKEASGDYNAAVRLYEAAGENDAVVRLLLEALNRTDLAIEVVDRTRSPEGAKMVAAHFMKMKDFASAIRYLLISGRGEEAFLTAQQHQQMDIFSTVVGDDQPAALYEKIAAFYESKRDVVRSARYLVRANQARRAVDLLLKLLKQTTAPAGLDEDAALTELINATVKCGDASTTDVVSQFLLGTDDGTPRDEKYLLDLYLLSEKFHEADRITLLVADHHLRNGDYRDAHQVLYRTFDRLIKANQNPSSQLWETFVLVHSHAVSTVMYSLKEHDKVARMLVRICRNISKFPKDASRFLLSAVLECTKCQLNKSAMQFALVLMQPEHRSIVTAKYESKILNILRKGDRVFDADEELTDCPYAEHKFPASLLTCPLCKIRVPFCVLTGMHVIRNDFTICPGCAMPAIFSEVKACLTRGLDACPMCAVPWSSEIIRPSSSEETEAFFQRLDFLLNYSGKTPYELTKVS